MGDFGYWEHQPSGIYFLNYIENRAKATGVKCYFIDGNHENHTLLRARYMDRIGVGRDTESLARQMEEVEKKLGPWKPTQTTEGFYAVRKGLYYIPRSSTWTWSGVKFAALGGAFSIDTNYRKAGTSWWPEEMIEPDEVDALRDSGKVDIFLSHDVPVSVHIDTEMKSLGYEFRKADQRTMRNRTLLEKAVEYTHPNHLFHGHYHIQYDGEFSLHDGHVVQVHGLSRDGTGRESYKVIDLKDTND